VATPRATLSHDAFAIAAPGLETLVGAELREMGVKGARVVAGGVEFKADARLLARANIRLRVASRVLVRLARFRATAFHELERAARQVEWARMLAPGTTFALRVTCKKSRLYHSGGVAQRVADAILRGVAGATLAAKVTNDEDEREASEEGDASSRDSGTPPQLFVVRLDHDECTISADASGELLHRRGYRKAIAKAPLRETLAAAMLLGADYDPSQPFVDPMCGSGTIAIEAAMIARGIAPGIARDFAAQRWPQMDATAWKSARDAARDLERDRASAPILACDRDAGAIEAARSNAARAGVEGDIEFRVAALSALEPPAGPGLLLTNPPYGIRVGETKPLRDLFARFGQVAYTRLGGWRVGMLSANGVLEAQTRLDFEERFKTTNGGIPVRLVVAEVPPSM
jgi:putative N6-adenine-specific DNA methylase